MLATPTVAAPPHLETWHRLNPETADSAAEHEQLHCLPGRQWVCRYDKLPEPELELTVWYGAIYDGGGRGGGV